MAKRSAPLQPADPKMARELTEGARPATEGPVSVGQGGELHQQAQDVGAQLTTNQGVLISEEYLELAVRALHSAFGLDKE